MMIVIVSTKDSEKTPKVLCTLRHEIAVRDLVNDFQGFGKRKNTNID
jgi:hypothetical protein